VLQRQRDRLDNIAEQFHLSKTEIRQISPDRHSQISSDLDGVVLSASTNNLEKAYEDLEREIMEIKAKLQSSNILSSSSNNFSAANQS